MVLLELNNSVVGVKRFLLEVGAEGKGPIPLWAHHVASDDHLLRV